MQFSAVQTILALILVYGIYIGIYLMSPAPLYVATISSVLFLVFGTGVWYIGFKSGTYRTTRLRSDRVSGEDSTQTVRESSE